MLTFKNKADTLEFLRGLPYLTETAHTTGRNASKVYFYPSGTYYLSHGEYAQPDIVPRRYADGWGVHVEYFYYVGTLNGRGSGRVDPAVLAELYGHE